MKCVKNELVQIRRFIVEGDTPGVMDPVYLDIDIEDEHNITMTISDHYNTTYSYTWCAFNHPLPFLQFIAGKNLSLGYIRRKLGIEPNVLNLSKSKREANKYFFRYAHSDTPKAERGLIASEISSIQAFDARDFNDQVYSIISDYVDDADNWAVCDYSVKQQRFLEAIKIVSRELGKEFNC